MQRKDEAKLAIKFPITKMLNLKNKTYTIKKQQKPKTKTKKKQTQKQQKPKPKTKTKKNLEILKIVTWEYNAKKRVG